MLIETIDCQKIVNRLMNLLENNINIMNEKGIIIASGDKDRIQTFHEAAKAAINERKVITVDEDKYKKEIYSGAQKGINIPIYYNSQIVGVVGISGEPSKVEGYGIIVKELVELMIQNEESKKIELYQSRSVRNFAKELIKEHREEDRELFSYRSQLVDFKLDVPRVVIVADANFFSSYIEQYGEDSEVTREMIKQNIVDIINGLSKPRIDLAINLYMDRFVILKNCSDDTEEYCKLLQKELSKKYILKFNMGIGSVCNKFEDYNKSYILASKALDIGKKLNPDKNLFFVDDYKLQMLMSNLTNDQKQEYLSNMGLLKLANSMDNNTVELMNTIKVYFECGMNLQTTANKLFLHRNTVNYRINKFKESFGFDLNNPYKCAMLYIAINLLELR
ncbi:MAG: sugar diacid recognition domain-containing protein [Bacillota bacterium]|nr:sugar diacid recognition domain-containing protein [Bacillota bacterium]